MDMRSLLTLSVLLALVREDKGQKPAVSLLPRFPDVFVGDDITLICKEGGGLIEWFINGKPKSHQDHLMLLTAVTSKDNGTYECKRGGLKSDPYTLTVVELEPHAQLSPSEGGAVMSKGGGRNLVLQVDDDPNGWTCFALRGENGFKLGTDVKERKTVNTGVIYAELKEAKRATFWCKNGTRRSNAVTLKMTELKVMLEPPAVPALVGESVTLRCAVWGGKAEKAEFYKDNKPIPTTTITEDSYIITNATQDHTGQYRCHATYRYSHISAEAARQEGDSDAQEFKVIGGPPAATVDSTFPKILECVCRDCPGDCTSCYWYHTLFTDSFARQRLPENTRIITVEKEGQYSCRMGCGKGFSRFSNVYSYRAQPESVGVLPIIVAAILMVIGVLIVVLIALKRRRRGGSSVQATAQGKDKKKDGDYEQIQLTDQAVYHTLGENTDKDKAEGGYEALKKRQEEGVYHTLGAAEGQGQGEGQGGYEALKSVKAEVYHTLGAAEGQGQGEGQGGYEALKSVKAEVYHTLGAAEGQGQGEGQGGYEALKSVKTEVYQTLSSDDSKKPAGESEGGYEQLPQKAKNAEDVAENPYEELKAGQQDKKQMSKEKE